MNYIIEVVPGVNLGEDMAVAKGAPLDVVTNRLQVEPQGVMRPTTRATSTELKLENYK